MKNFTQVAAALRRKSISQYGLLAGCCFFSVLLITAYVTIMFSPTVLTILPEGGDSRRQVFMIFVLAVIGCGVFTTYASGLFFRYKSREVGTFLALGATKAKLRRVLSGELLLLATISCALGTLLGTPLAWALWQGFRVMIVDSEEMVLTLAPQALFYALAFSAFVFVMLFVMLARFLKRTNILDVIHEARKSETVRLVPQYFGALGIALIVTGCFLGYIMPGVFVRGLKWYAPEGLTAIFYLPALVGLYMVLLHTVVNGWQRGKNRYKGLIGVSMMQFEGRQTVRTMIVVALLVAGGFFASFYTPLMMTSSAYTYQNRAIDYLFHYRADQNLPDEIEIRSMAEVMGVTITDYASVTSAILGLDGQKYIETDNGVMGTTYDHIYTELLDSDTFLSESSYYALTGETVDVLPGTVVPIFDDEGSSAGRMTNDLAILTNTLTGEQFSVTAIEAGLKSTLLFGIRVLDDSDYARMTAGLSDDWQETIVAFNVEKVEETYAFAKALFHEIVDRSGDEVALFDAWDPVEKLLATEEGEVYFYDNEALSSIGYAPLSYEKPDSNEFRIDWKYMPQFRVMDETDFIRTMAVFLILFVFVTTICFAAVMVILYTRSMTIAMTNRHIYEDLGKLGASKSYLYGTVKSQISRIFVAPIATGTALISIFYTMILYFNSGNGEFTSAELLSGRNCLLIIVGMLVLFYGLYRFTLSRVCDNLRLKK